MPLPKENRLKAKKDFDNIFKNGRSIRGHFLLIKTIGAVSSSPRVGFIVPAKTVKKAVTRNKVKRILSSMVQQNLNKIRKDMVVLLLKMPLNKKEVKEALSKELWALISKING